LFLVTRFNHKRDEIESLEIEMKEAGVN